MGARHANCCVPPFMKPSTRFLILASFLGAMGLGCSSATGGGPYAADGGISDGATRRTDGGGGIFDLPSGGGPAKNQSGRFVLQVSAPEDETEAAFAARFGPKSPTAQAFELANSLVTLPSDLPVHVGKCGIENAFYAPAKHAIFLCYELLAAIGGAFLDRGAPPEWADNAMAFVALHEAGHAFLGENKIGVLGKEEDVADDLSAMTFIGQGHPEIPLHGVVGLLALGAGHHDYADEHSFSEQRYYAILCLIYGSDPNTGQEIVGEGEGRLPERRAERCPSEWDSKVAATRELLGPYRRQK